MASYTVGYFVGSLSSTSINRLLAKALTRLAPPELQLVEIPIRDLPLYSPDYDADYPPVAQAFKKAIADCDAVLFVTPEYNRSIPGALKNAIDWASRPWGKNSWAGKPTAIAGATLGAVGTAAAQSQLRSVVSAVGAALTAQPEIYLNFREGLIVDGEITDENFVTLLKDWTERFADWIARLRQPVLSF